MAKNLHVRPLGLLARIADIVMVPVMYLVSGATEKPQRTHRWNNMKLTPRDVEHLDLAAMVHCDGIPDVGRLYHWNIPAFHTPLFGGWRSYVVLRPYEKEVEWYVGWITDDVIGVSRIELRGSVRLLLGPEETFFFGISTEGICIPIHLTGTGSIGDHGPHGQVPLL